jgi:hypothetical protein
MELFNEFNMTEPEKPLFTLKKIPNMKARKISSENRRPQRANTAKRRQRKSVSKK